VRVTPPVLPATRDSLREVGRAGLDLQGDQPAQRPAVGDGFHVSIDAEVRDRLLAEGPAPAAELRPGGAHSQAVDGKRSWHSGTAYPLQLRRKERSPATA